MTSSSDDPLISAEVAERAAISRAASYRTLAEEALTAEDRAYYTGLARAHDAVASSQRHVIESLVARSLHQKFNFKAEPSLVYTCVLRDGTQVLMAVDYMAWDDAAAIAHLKEHCAATSACTEGQLWKAGEKIFTHRPNDDEPVS